MRMRAQTQVPCTSRRAASQSAGEISRKRSPNSSKASAHDLQGFLKVTARVRQAKKTSFKLGWGEVHAVPQAAMKIIAKCSQIRFYRVRKRPDWVFREKEAEH